MKHEEKISFIRNYFEEQAKMAMQSLLLVEIEKILITLPTQKEKDYFEKTMNLLLTKMFTENFADIFKKAFDNAVVKVFTKEDVDLLYRYLSSTTYATIKEQAAAFYTEILDETKAFFKKFSAVPYRDLYEIFSNHSEGGNKPLEIEKEDILVKEKNVFIDWNANKIYNDNDKLN